MATLIVDLNIARDTNEGCELSNDGLSQSHCQSQTTYPTGSQYSDRVTRSKSGSSKAKDKKQVNGEGPVSPNTIKSKSKKGRKDPGGKIIGTFDVSRITDHKPKKNGSSSLLYRTHWILNRETREEFTSDNDITYEPLENFIHTTESGMPYLNEVFMQYLRDNKLTGRVPAHLQINTNLYATSQDTTNDAEEDMEEKSEYDTRDYDTKGEYGPNTKLLQIPFDKIGLLVSNNLSITDIPEQLRGRVRKVYIEQMEKMKRNVSNSEEWLKFMLLPTILFGQYNDKISTKASMKRALSRLQRGDWSFTLGEFKKKRDITTELSKVKAREVLYKKAMVCAQKGEISKAMSIITSTASLVQPSQKVVDELQQKFPHNNQYMFDQEEIESFTSYVLPDNCRKEVKPQVLRQIINSLRHLIRPAHDGL